MALVHGDEDLVAWQKAIDLCEPVYKLAYELPRDERFELSSQMRRAVVSVAANIAEGAARHGSGEFAQFLGIALGSLAEVDTLLAIAGRVGLLPTDRVASVRKQIIEVRRILHGLSDSIHRRIQHNRHKSRSA